jgi:hypothetical protein
MSRVVYFNVRIIDDITHFHGGMPTGVRIGALCSAVHTGCLYYCARDQVKECRAWHCSLLSHCGKCLGHDSSIVGAGHR